MGREHIIKLILSTLKRLKTDDLMHVYKITSAYAERGKNAK